MDNNIVPIGSVYPAAAGGTLATAASAASPDQYGAALTGPVSDGAPAAVAAPAAGMGGNALAWWGGILVLVALMMFAARKSGNAEEFRAIGPSAYNVALITFVAILGITFMKVVAVRVRNVPGLGGFASIVIAA